MATITLQHDTSPEVAESKVYAAVLATGEAVVQVHGFNEIDLAHIIARLPDQWEARQEGPAVVRIRRNRTNPNASSRQAIRRQSKADGDRTPVNVAIGSLNLGGQGPHKLADNEIVSDVRKVIAAGVSILNLQEVNPKEARQLQAVQTAVPRGWEVFVPTGQFGAIPIAYDANEWELIRSGKRVTLAHGREKLTPGRAVSYVVLRNRRTGHIVTNENTHTVAGGFDRKDKPTDPWIREQWYRHIGIQGDLTAWLRRRFPGAASFLSGDYNNVRQAPDIEDVSWDNGKHALDRQGHVRSRDVEHLDSQDIDGLNTDHRRAPVQRYRLR